MIIANDSRWSICTPTKCGTYSLEATLIDRAEVAWKYVPRHSCEKHVAMGERIMVVRNPLDRWCSMYWFIVKETGKGIWMEKYSEDINEFVIEWNRRRREQPHWMWTENLSYHYKSFEPATVFKLETNGYQDLLRYLHEKYEVPMINVSHKNVTRSRRNVQETLALLTPENRVIVEKFCEPDLQLWYNS